MHLKTENPMAQKFSTDKEIQLYWSQEKAMTLAVSKMAMD